MASTTWVQFIKGGLLVLFAAGLTVLILQRGLHADASTESLQPQTVTIKPDGTGVRRLTHARGNDAHQGWSPDGEHIVFASTRMGFKDEMTYTDAPQPYGELFVMRSDGSHLEQLTDNQWEDGTPAWQPVRRTSSSR